jgi:pimeloyl-ACP methyl ester carboxylesterase
VELLTAEGVALNAVHWRARSMDLCVVLAQGFTNNVRTPHIRSIARWLVAEGVGVLSYDSRGHGRSGGHSTVGDLEPLDLNAVVAEARLRGYRRVVTCGWSMGGSVVIRRAALRGKPSGRAVARVVLRTRIWHEHWDPVPVSPVQCIADEGPGAQLWIEKGMGHTEKAAAPDLVARRAQQIQALVSA